MEKTNFLKNKDIIYVEDFTTKQLEEIIEKAHEFEKRYLSGNITNIANKYVDKKLALLFWENSTRTYESFKGAMQTFGGKIAEIRSAEGTSIKKNESIKDTGMMFWGYKADMIAMRHPKDGAVQWMADVLGIPVINGGDGKNQHPTQTFLDIATIAKLKKEEYGMNTQDISQLFNGLKIGFGGDLAKGRTMHSLMTALSNFENISFHWSAHDEFALPDYLEKAVKEKGHTIERYDNIKDVMANSEILYMTRTQKERSNLSKNIIDEITRKYRVTLKRIKEHNPHIYVMHPLPIDSVAQEIESKVDDTNNAYYYIQAQMGIHTREALIDMILDSSDKILYTGRIDPNLNKEINSKIILPIKQNNLKNNEPYKKDNFVKRINKGIVIDHIPLCGAERIIKEMEFSSKNYDLAVMYNAQSTSNIQKDIIKVNGKHLSNRYIKQIIMMYPNVTFNVIDEGKVIEKFKYQICDNDNCITRVINEDVPVKFYESGNKLKCHYCRREKD